MSDTKSTKAERKAAHQRFLDRLSDWGQPGAITLLNSDGTPIEFDAEGRRIQPGGAELPPAKR